MSKLVDQLCTISIAMLITALLYTYGENWQKKITIKYYEDKLAILQGQIEVLRTQMEQVESIFLKIQ